jgi:capsular polysaccharide biosynthesis protein
MRFLFVTLQHLETAFYGRVGALLAERGHEAFHLTCSRRGAIVLRRRGAESFCLPDLMKTVRPIGSWAEEETRIVESYPIPNLRDVQRLDPGRHGGRFDVERVVRHFLAIEDLVERIAPDAVGPEVGNETIRNVSRLVADAHGAASLYLAYTIFDRPLRLYAGTMDAPIVDRAEVRALSAAEEQELDEFIARYTARNEPIRDYRRVAVNGRRLRLIARHFAVRALWDRDNDYLEPWAWLARDGREVLRGRAARSLYSPEPARRSFVYFPLQVAEDYKLARLRPHCTDQEAIVRLLANALPPGVELVVKEHPVAIGRNRLGMLGRLAREPGIRLVDPHTSSLALIRRATAVATISSTVGLEALLYGKPVLTIGRPNYSGYGVTVDVDGPERAGEGIAAALGFQPHRDQVRRFLGAAMRRCEPGAPVLVDSSERNAELLAETLDRAAQGELVEFGTRLSGSVPAADPRGDGGRIA